MRIAAVLLLASLAHADDVDPEPQPDRAKSLEKIAKTMGDITKRLKDASVGDETQRLQERVLAQLDEALRKEKARAKKAPRGHLDVVAGLARVQAMQTQLATSVKRLARLGGGGKERVAELAELSEYQAKVAQMLREVAAHCKPER